jgi:hypothetical protein
MKIFGIILVAVGILGLIYQGISYTTQEQVFKLGPLEATAEKRETIPISPLASMAAIVAGISIFALGIKDQSFA